MDVREIMTPDPFCCTADTSLEEVAKAMVEHDCGEIPIVRSSKDRTLIGVVTDRDIVCRTVAKGKNPQFLNASDCMTSQVTTVTPETNLDTCCHLMEERQVRRIPVVDALGNCYGIISQADIVQACEPEMTAEVLKDISRHTDASSRAAVI